MSKKLSRAIITGVCLFLFIFAHSVFAGINCEKCQERINKGLETYRLSCSSVEDLIQSIFKEYRGLKEIYHKAVSRRTELKRQVKKLQREFEQIIKEYDSLYEDAARSNLLIKDERLAQSVSQGKPPAQRNSPLIFPLEAYSFDPVQIAKIRKIVEKELELTRKWDQLRQDPKRLETLNKLAEDFNKWIKKQEHLFNTRYKNLGDLKAKLLKIYESNQYAHCLGEYDVNKAEDLPGIKPWLDRGKLKKAFAPVKFPVCPNGEVALPRVPVLLDGRTALKTWEELYGQQFKAQWISAGVSILQAVHSIVKLTRDVSVGFVKGMCYDLPKSVVMPLSNLFDQKQGWIQAMGNTAYDYASLAKALTYDALAGIVNDAAQILKNTVDLSNKIAQQTPSAKGIVELSKNALSTLHELNQSLKKLHELNQSYEKFQGGGTLTQKDVANLLERLKKIQKFVQVARNISHNVEAAEKNFEKYVLDSAERGFNLYLGLRPSGKPGATSSLLKTSAKELGSSSKSFLKGLIDKVKETIERRRSSGEKFRAAVNEATAVSEAKYMAQITRQPSRVPKSLEKRDLNNLTKGKFSEFVKSEKKPKAVTHTGKPKPQTGVKEFKIVENGKIKTIKTKFLAKGTAKEAYEFTTADGRQMVIKIFKNEKETKVQLERLEKTAKRLDEAGVSYLKYKKVKLADGRIAIIDQKFDPSTLMENVLRNTKKYNKLKEYLKKNRDSIPPKKYMELRSQLEKLSKSVWTPEHTRAYIELQVRLLKQGKLLTDPNAGNISTFMKDGKLVAQLIDLDGVVDVKDLIKSGQHTITAGLGNYAKTFDLRDPKQVIELQKYILFGDKKLASLFKEAAQKGTKEAIDQAVGRAKHSASLLSHSLSTSGYKNPPVTVVGGIGRDFAKVLNRKEFDLLYKSFVANFKRAREKLAKTEFFKKLKEESQTPAQRFTLELEEAVTKQLDAGKMPKLTDINIDLGIAEQELKNIKLDLNL